MVQTTANRRGGWAGEWERRSREGAGAAGAAGPLRPARDNPALRGRGEEKVKQAAPELAGVVSDVKWQKYDAICHVVLPLRARKGVGGELLGRDLGK